MIHFGTTSVGWKNYTIFPYQHSSIRNSLLSCFVLTYIDSDVRSCIHVCADPAVSSSCNPATMQLERGAECLWSSMEPAAYTARRHERKLRSYDIKPTSYGCSSKNSSYYALPFHLKVSILALECEPSFISLCLLIYYMAIGCYCPSNWCCWLLTCNPF